MKDLKQQSRSSTLRSVSLQIRNNQVTVKVKSAVPRPAPVARPAFR